MTNVAMQVNPFEGILIFYLRVFKAAWRVCANFNPKQPTNLKRQFITDRTSMGPSQSRHWSYRDPSSPQGSSWT